MPMCEAIKHGKASRDALMCQNCGAVMVANYDRMKSHRKNGFSYCDKECMYQDKGRIYRTFESYRSKMYRPPQNDQAWKADVCKVYFFKCCICKTLGSSRNSQSCTCSLQCKRKLDTFKAWLSNRAKQTPKEVTCAGCGVMFTTLVRTRYDVHWCGDKCRMRHSRKQAKHRRRERVKVACGVVRGKVSLASQYRKHKGKCQICCCKVVMSSVHREDMATVDHIVPLSKGGLHVEDNVQLACWKCNTKKSNIITQSQQMLLY